MFSDASSPSCGDYFTIAPHGMVVTHMNALCHFSWKDQFYNGRKRSETLTASGAKWGSIHAQQQGIFTRGVLLDVAAARGVSWYKPDEYVTVADFEAAEKRQRLRVESGDAIFVRTGMERMEAELDKGAGALPDREGDLTFLSARPYDRAGIGESMTRSMLDENGVKNATVLSGDFLHLIGNSSIADKKFDNWQQYRQLFPEYKSVFIGDSGQGDAIFGAKAVSTAPSDMKAVFIHNVTNMSPEDRQAMAQKGVFVFDTYVGAATEAFRRGLITREGLERVASSASVELDTVHFDSQEQRAARKAELDRDIAEMRSVLSQRS